MFKIIFKKDQIIKIFGMYYKIIEVNNFSVKQICVGYDDKIYPNRLMGDYSNKGAIIKHGILSLFNLIYRISDENFKKHLDYIKYKTPHVGMYICKDDGFEYEIYRISEIGRNYKYKAKCVHYKNNGIKDLGIYNKRDSLDLLYETYDYMSESDALQIIEGYGNDIR